MIRIVLFGSFYRGYYVLDELLNGPYRDHFEVVGVATDDVSQAFTSPGKRVWQYPHDPADETMVEVSALQRGLPVFKGRVKSEPFYQLYEGTWRPDACLSATFGQRFDERLFRFPSLGFFNMHPCIDDGWPSRYAGPNPFQAMLDDGLDHLQVALHRVDAGLDTGALIGMSPRIAFPPKPSVVDLHKISSPVVAQYAVSTLAVLTGASLR